MAGRPVPGRPHRVPFCYTSVQIGLGEGLGAWLKFGQAKNVYHHQLLIMEMFLITVTNPGFNKVVFPGGSRVMNPPAKQEMWVWSLGWEDPLEKEMATHSSILAWETPRTEEPGGLLSKGPQRIRHDWAHTHHTTHTHTRQCMIRAPLKGTEQPLTGKLVQISRKVAWWCNCDCNLYITQLHYLEST